MCGEINYTLNIWGNVQVVLQVNDIKLETNSQIRPVISRGNLVSQTFS